MQKEGLSKLFTELHDVIPKSVLTNKNKRKSWDYGFDEKYGIVVISTNGTIGKIIQMNGVDIALPKEPEYINDCDQFSILDLTNQHAVDDFFMRNHFDEVYQLAADMGGADYIFIGDNDLDVMTRSMQINLNVIDAVRTYNIPKIFYSSSACVYSEYKQVDRFNIDCRESAAYPANPDSEYGWEKLFSERLL